MKVLIASSLDPATIAELEREHDVVCAFGAGEGELVERMADREAVVFRSGVQISRAVMAAAPNLKLLIRAGSGLDNVDVAYARERNIRIERIPGPGARAVAELAFADMLALSRELFRVDKGLRQGVWLKDSARGYLLQGKTIGIVGLGSIGETVAKMALGWQMNVIGCVKEFCESRATYFRRQEIELTTLEDVIERSDFLCLHVPRTESTIGMIDERAFSKMKKGAFLINLARGGVVDERALLKTLSCGHLAGAALDVHEMEGDGFKSPFADVPNVILTPHIGAQTVDSQREIGKRVRELLELCGQSDKVIMEELV